MEQQLTERFENALTRGRNLRNRIQRDGRPGRWVEFEPYHHWQAQTLTLLRAVFGQDSDYARNFETVTTAKGTPIAELVNVDRGMGVLNGAAEDFTNRWSRTYPETLRADVFGDLLETAEQLLRDDYVAAAAVTAGGALEVHVKKLAHKHGVPLGRVAIMNQALWREKGAYTQPEWRSVDSWYDLRNAAAHQDDASPRSAPQVQLMIAGVRDFIIRHPA
jgi:hypothetical protein